MSDYASAREEIRRSRRSWPFIANLSPFDMAECQKAMDDDRQAVENVRNAHGCPDWVESGVALFDFMESAHAAGILYNGKQIECCLWCGEKIVKEPDRES